jgi:hypothetical protein
MFHRQIGASIIDNTHASRTQKQVRAAAQTCVYLLHSIIYIEIQFTKTAQVLISDH